MVSGKEHVRVRIPSALRDALEHPPTRLVDKLILDVRQRVDFAHLVMSHLRGNESARRAFTVPKTALVPVQPMTRLLRQNLHDLLARAGMPWRQVEVAPVDPARLRHWWIPRVMRIGKAHPDEPILVRRERIEIGNRAFGNPVSMIVLARNRIVHDFGRASVAAGNSHQRDRKPFYLVWIIILEPFRVMHSPEWPMQGEFQMLETAMRPGRFFVGHSVFG